MAKATITMPPGVTLTLDGFLRELTAGCRALPMMVGLPPVEKHLGTEFTYQVAIRGDLVARLEDGRVWNAEWQTSHKPELGQRLVDTHRGIERDHKPPGIVQHVLRLDGVGSPARVTAVVAGHPIDFEVLTPADLDLEPLFASDNVNDKIMACLLTPKPGLLIDVVKGLRELPEEDQARALKLFMLMTQFRMDRDSLPEEVLQMVTDVIEIDYKRNPVTRTAWRDGHERSAVRLLSLFGPVDDEERTRIAEMGNDELERYEAELFEKVAERFPAEDSTPSP